MIGLRTLPCISAKENENRQNLQAPDQHTQGEHQLGQPGEAGVVAHRSHRLQAGSHVVDAGGSPSAAAPGACFIDSASSFALIRGGHVDATILGGLEVDEEGSLANWIIPGKKMPGMGGAMDLLVGAKNVIVAMEHTAKGMPKILKKCKLPYTAVKCITKIITEMGVMLVTPEGLLLTEYNPEFTVEQIQEATEATLIISPELKPMA